MLTPPPTFHRLPHTCLIQHTETLDHAQLDRGTLTTSHTSQTCQATLPYNTKKCSHTQHLLILMSLYPRSQLRACMLHPYTYSKTTCYLLYHNLTRGVDQVQAICQAMHDALANILTLCSGHVILWLRPKMIPEKILTLSPHRDTYTPKPSHIAYASPNGNKPPPAIQAAIDTGDHLIFSSMIHSL